MIPLRLTRRRAGTGRDWATSSEPLRARAIPVGRMPTRVARTPSRCAEMRPVPTTVPPTTIRDYLRRLTDRGQVERAPNPADGRSYLVKLTPDGRRIVARGRPLVGAVFRRVEPHLTRPAEEYVERSRELRQALAIARDAAAERRSAAA